jgi:hypothetical protein
MSLEKVAKHLASKGRDEDTMLVHMTPKEVHGLQALAKAHGGSLTVNPDTGLPEAGFLKSILPTLVGVGLNMFAPGLGTAATMAIGAGVGALTNRQDPLMGAITGGLGAYGGSSLGSSLQAGLNAAATPAATNVALPAAASTPSVVNAPVMGNWTPITGAEAAPIAATPPPTIAQSIEAAMQKPEAFIKGAGGASNLIKSGMYASAPLAMMQPETGSRGSYLSEPVNYEYDPGYTEAPASSNFTAERRYFNPKYKKLAEGGTVQNAQPQFVSQSTVPTFAAMPQQAGFGGLAQPKQPATDQEIKNYVQDAMAMPGMADWQKAGLIRDRAQQYGVSNEKLAAVTGYNLPTVDSYLNQLSYNPVIPQQAGIAGLSQAAFQPQAQPNISGIQNLPTQYGTTLPSHVEDQRIKDYVTDVTKYRQGLTDAQRGEEIDRTAQQFGVTRDQLARATGYSLDQVNNYLGYMRPDIAPTGNMRGASSDIMKYLYGVPSGGTGEKVSQPVQTVADIQKGIDAAKKAEEDAIAATGIKGYKYNPHGSTTDTMNLDFTPEEVKAGGKKVIVYTGADSHPESHWVPVPKASAPTSTPKTEPAKQTASTAEIKNYVQSVLNDQSLTPAQRSQTINWKAGQYGVSRAQLAEATGYSLKEVEDYLSKGYAAGGGLRSGGFVVPADVVSALGNGSTDAGLEVLMQKFNAKPIDGPGDGMSDSIPTTIEGRQRARVARGEAYISPEDVQRFGGSKKFYAMLDRIRRNAHGKTTQQRQVKPEKLV